MGALGHSIQKSSCCWKGGFSERLLENGSSIMKTLGENLLTRALKDTSTNKSFIKNILVYDNL